MVIDDINTIKEMRTPYYFLIEMIGKMTFNKIGKFKVVRGQIGGVIYLQHDYKQRTVYINDIIYERIRNNSNLSDYEIDDKIVNIVKEYLSWKTYTVYQFRQS